VRHSGGNLVQLWTTARGMVEPLVGMGADEQAATLLGALTGSASATEPYGDDVERLAAARATLAERASAFVLEPIDQALSSRPA
jgi:hypothetical protein